MNFSKCVAFCWVLFFASVVHSQEKLDVDFADIQGTIKPLHGVNGGPLCDGEMVDLTKHWQAAGIPSTRLHDCDWPRPDVVDFHAIFPNPDADPSLPESYTFAKTDDYLDSVKKSGAKIIFRLGESIEHSKKKYHVNPPRDPVKWAAACCGIIRHYNHGWANGFEHGIEYWEIWNEPENRPAMWTGTDEQFIELYSTVATAIKKEFPNVKVGGPSVGATGEIVGGKWQRTKFLDSFLEHCRREQVPLDFFSWHTYSNDPTIYAKKAKAIRAWLNENGFEKAEQHLNEWNYLPRNDWSAFDIKNQGPFREKFYAEMSGPTGAAFLAYALCDLQDSPVDVSNIYAGNNGGFGLFSQHGTPKKAYYAVRAFGMLNETPRRVKVTGGVPGKWIASAGLSEDGKSATVLLANYDPRGLDVSINLLHMPEAKSWKATLAIVDEHSDLGSQSIAVDVSQPLPLELAGPGVAVLRLQK